MKTISLLLVGSILFSLPIVGRAQPIAEAPLYNVTVVGGTTQAINYQYRGGSTRIGFRGTVLLPDARGEAKVKSRQDAVTIDVQLRNLEPASKFGPEYMTYVLWAISPAGKTANLGELIVNDGESRLTATTPLQTFGLIVTAEPYFAVTQVSNVVVLENIVTEETRGKIEQVKAQYELLPRGQYTLEKNPVDLHMEMNKDISPYVYQARNASRIAWRAKADVYASDEFKRAQGLLQQIEQEKDKQNKTVVAMARQVIQQCEDARLIALKRQEAENLTNERQAAAQKLLRTKEGAEAVRVAALTETQKAQQEAQAAETARAAALAETKKAQQEAQFAETARAASLVETQKAQQNALESDQARQKSEVEKTELRRKLKVQLSKILETQDTARGLIVNMSDVLFDSGKTELKGPAREKLAKITGILLAYSGLRVEVEGHTDSVGSDELNRTLSQNRAASVMSYLVEQGLSRDSIVARGFGKTKPIASNDTQEGRQKNRRVELVVSGNEITAQATPPPVKS